MSNIKLNISPPQRNTPATITAQRESYRGIALGRRFTTWVDIMKDYGYLVFGKYIKHDVSSHN